MEAKPTWELTSRWRTFLHQNINAGTLQQVPREMTNYKVEILYVSEAIWTNEVGGESLRRDKPYSTPGVHRGGVAVIVMRKVEKTLLELV